jgi:hypothetical protein
MVKKYNINRRKSRRYRHAPLGDEISVYIEYIPAITYDSFEERRDLLVQVFQEVATKLLPLGVRVDMESLGVLGQFLQAVVPADSYGSVEKALIGAPFRMKKQDIHQVLLALARS